MKFLYLDTLLHVLFKAGDDTWHCTRLCLRLNVEHLHIFTHLSPELFEMGPFIVHFDIWGIWSAEKLRSYLQQKSVKF